MSNFVPNLIPVIFREMEVSKICKFVRETVKPNVMYVLRQNWV